MNCLITGASGFIGSRLVKLLLDEGHSVNYVGRSRNEQLDGRAAFFHWEISKLPPLDCMGRLDAVIHLAGEPVAQRWNPDVKQRIWSSRVEGTRHLVNAIGALRHKPTVIVSASAIGYYGNGGETALTETSCAGTGFLADLCVQWEAEATRARDLGVRVVPIRIALVLGSGGGMMARLLPLFRLGLGGKLANGQQWMSWIHVDDLLAVLMFAVENADIAAPLNASSPNPVRNGEFTQELAHAVNRPAVLPVPKFALQMALGPVANHILDSSRVLPERAIEYGFQFLYPDLRSCCAEVAGRSG